MAGTGSPGAHVVRFGPFELDLRSAELRKAGMRLPLQDQPFRVLEQLLSRPGHLVTREELRRELWPENTFVDFEHGLNAAIKRLRDALADSADTPRFVQTLPRRGYRFIAAVEWVPDSPDSRAMSTSEPELAGSPPAASPPEGRTPDSRPLPAGHGLPGAVAVPRRLPAARAFSAGVLLGALLAIVLGTAAGWRAEQG